MPTLTPMRLPLLLLVLSTLTAAGARAEPVPVGIGTAYASARAALIAKGYRPVRSGERDDGRCSAGRQDVCTAYPETVSCSGTGAAPCRFIFTRPGGAGVTIEAEGRDVGRLRVTASRLSAKRDVDWQRAAR